MTTIDWSNDLRMSDAEVLAAIDKEIAGTFMTAQRLPPQFNPYKLAEPILEMPEHQDIHAGGAVIDWLFRTEIKKKQGRFILGTCYMPRVTGDLSDLFDYMLDRLLGRKPTFLIVLSWDFWRDATPLQREILVHHELMHAEQAKDIFGVPRFNRETGEPIFAIRGHDLEEFNQTVRRYGAHNADIDAFLKALADNMESAPNDPKN